MRASENQLIIAGLNDLARPCEKNKSAEGMKMGKVSERHRLDSKGTRVDSAW